MCMHMPAHILTHAHMHVCTNSHSLTCTHTHADNRPWSAPPHWHCRRLERQQYILFGHKKYRRSWKDWSGIMWWKTKKSVIPWSAKTGPSGSQCAYRVRKELITQYVKRGYQCAYRVRNEIRGFAKIGLLLNRTNCWHIFEYSLLQRR